VCTVVARTQSCVKICCKECIGLEFDEESKRLCKEVEGQEQRNARKVGKNYFRESLDLSLTNFLEKQEVLGRSKSLRRSSSKGITLYKKCGRDEIQETDSREGQRSNPLNLSKIF
jgi:hypothetical protein